MTLREQIITLFAKRSVAVPAFLGMVVLFIVLRALPHRALFAQFFALPDISLVRRWEVFYEYTILSFGNATLYEQFISIFLPIAIVVNIVVTIAYYRQQASLLRGKSIFASGAGLLLGLFGVGCFACSGLLLAPLLAFLGLSGMVALFPYRGLEIGAVGVIVLFGISGALMHKMRHGAVCKP